MRSLCCLAACLVLCAGLAFPAAGAEPPADATSLDRVLLRNGDRLSGHVVSLLAGVLTFETAYAGKLAIDVAAVAGIETAGPVRLELAQGEPVEGQLVTAPPDQLAIASASGERVLALSEIVAINPPPAVRYTGTVSLGANVKSGNTDQSSLSLAAQGERTTDENRVQLRLRWNDAEDAGVTTSRSTFGAAQYDHFLGERSYAFVSTELLADEFKDLDLQTVIAAGLGWDVLTGERLKLSLEAGPSYLSRNFILAEDEDEFTLRLASKLDWQLSGKIRLADHLILYPTFEESGVVLRNELSLTTVIAAGWAMEVSNVLDYDSEPPPGVQEEDLLWVVGLQYAF